MQQLPDPGDKADPPAPGRWATWRDRDHTHGSLGLSLLVLSLPLLTTSASAVLFQLLDLKLISGLGETATTGIVVTNQSLRQVFFLLVLGASFGAQGWISRLVGEGNADGAEHVAGQIVLVAGLLSLAIAASAGFLPIAALPMMNLTPDALAIGLPYAQLVLLLSFGFVFQVLLGTILQGAGDTTTPMLISLGQTAVALLAEWSLIYGHLGAPALGAKGVVIGLATGQVAGITASLSVLFRGASRVHLRRRHLRPDWNVLGNLAKLSWPPGLQMMSGFAVTIVFLSVAGEFGGSAQAAYSIGLRLGMIGPMVAFPIAGACATLVGQNLGSGSRVRTWRAFRVGLASHCAVLWSIAAAGAFFRYEVMAAFASDPEVIRIGAELLLFQSASFLFWGFYFPTFRTLQGAGDMVAPMFISLANSLLITLPLGFFLARWLELGPRGLFIAGLVGSATVAAATGGWLATGRWLDHSPRSA